MSEPDQLVASMELGYANAEGLFAALSDDEFGVQSLCPDWTARGVLQHLAGVETMLQGWVPDSAETPLPFEKVGAFMAASASMSNGQLLDAYREVIGKRTSELDALTEADLATPSMTPVGPQTYGRFVAIRAFDFWVHERDVRMPLARPSGNDGGLAAETALQEIHLSLGYIVGKKIGLPDGMGLTFHLHGPLTVDLHVLVDGRAAVVDNLDAPDVEVSVNSTSFIMMACGRIDPQVEIDAGRVTWSGDDNIGERAARNLAFTM
jgi:uncharacterized protein (TIGR03083 family)